MLKNYLTKIAGVIIGVTCLSANIFAQGSVESDASKKAEIAPQELGFVNAYLNSLKERSLLKTNKFGYEGKRKLGLFKNDIVVSGVVRFLTIYREMGDSYNDMSTSKRNISFMDSPISNNGSSANGYPMFELNLSSKFSKNTDFNIGYSFLNFMTGNSTAAIPNSSLLINMQNLRVGGTFSTAIGKFSFQGGSILPVKLSKFSMGQPIYRDDYFDRLPWDWYRNSFLRYEDYYNLKMNMGGQNEGRALFSGLTMNGTIIPLGLNFTALYGRSSQTAPYSTQIGGFFPSILYGGRLEKAVFTKDVNGKYGLNYYRRQADVDNYSGVQDYNQMLTLDGDMQFKGLKLVGEVAYSGIHNIVIGKDSTVKVPPVDRSDIGFQLKAEATKKILPLPLAAEIYYLPKNVVSFDGSILNTNSNFRSAGIATESKYDQNLLNNLVQEIGQYANNRKGLTLKSSFRVKKLSVDLGIMVSQEIENINDSVVTIQHRVNAFSRSRFHSFFMESGPYSRIRSVFRRTYENIRITQGDPTNKKAFNAAEIMLMYKAKFLGRDIVLMNYHTYSAATSNLAFANNFNNSAYTRQYYTDVTLAYKVMKKVTLVGNYGFERLLGGDNTVRDVISNGTVNQKGHSYGAAISYDYTATSSIHLRHKYFTHEDSNFYLDKFNGTETTLELKVFF